MYSERAISTERTVSLGIGPIMPAGIADQATWLTRSGRG